jgi:phage shock protein A
MATIGDFEGSKELEDKLLSKSGSDSDFKEVFSNLSCYDIESCLSEMLEKYQSLQSKYKDLKQVQVIASETRRELAKDISSLNEKSIFFRK